MIIGGKRSCGKTTELVKKANEDQLYIICSDRNRLRVITQIAKDMELDIPFPITVEELPLTSPYIKEVLIDDVEDVLYQLIRKPISVISSSLEFKQL